MSARYVTGRFLPVKAIDLIDTAGAWMARRAHVPDPPFRWNGIKGPWFDNNLAILEDIEDGLVISWVTGVVEHEDHLHPRLETVEVAAIEPRDG